MSKAWRWIGIGLVAVSASAGAGSGSDWLQAQAQPDGRYESASDLATPFEATAQAVRTLRLLGRNDALGAPVGFLNAETYHGTRYLARKIIANAEAGTPVPAFLTELLAHQNADRGFGELPGHDSSALQTAAALEALAILDQRTSAAAADGVQYLLDTQNPDGGWGNASNGTQVETTAVALRALAYYQDTFALTAPLRAGADLLYARRAGNDLWREDFVNALSVLALTASVSDFSTLDSSAASLRARQRADGSWSGDVYSTALALRALTLFGRRAGSTAGDAGSVEGFIVLADGTPVAGVDVAVSELAWLSTRSNADGYFRLAAVPAGERTLILSRAGFRSVGHVMSVQADALVSAGTLVLYAEDDPQAPATLKVLGHVVDGLGGQPIAGAQVSGPTGSALSDADGRFVLDGLTVLTFELQVVASGHASRSFGLSAPAYGEFGVTLALAPPGDPNAVTTRLFGRVTSAVTGEPIGNATLSIEGSAQRTFTAADGCYELSGIELTDFRLRVAAPAFADKTLPVQLAQHGEYPLDVTLDNAPGGGAFQIVSLETLTGPVGAEATHQFRARIANLGDAAAEVLVAGEIQDGAGAVIAKVTPYAPGTESHQSLFTFQASEVKDLMLPWNTAQWPPGTYRLELRLVQPGTKSGELPSGVVLAQASSYADVAATQAVAGLADFDPPVTQAGSATPVTLRAVLVNSGNVTLDAFALDLEVRNAAGTLLHTSQATVPVLGLSGFEFADFGQWTPTGTGNLSVTIRPHTGTVAGLIEGTLYVGAHPAGSFALDRTVVASGDPTVHATLTAQADDGGGAISDAKFFAIEEAVRTAGEYLDAETRAFEDSGHCLGCHIQSQALFGTATALAKGGKADPAFQTWVAGSIASAQKADGSLLTDFATQTNQLQTLMNGWALSALPDKAPNFRTLYRATQYLQSTSKDCRTQSWAISTAERQTCWPVHRDHYWSYRWFGSVSSYAMMGMRVYADLARSAETVDLTQVPDYRVSTVQQVKVAFGTHNDHRADLEQPQAGVLYMLQVRPAYADQFGAAVVSRFDLNAGTSTLFGIPGTPATVVGMAVAADETIYLSTSDGKILHVDPARNVALLYASPVPAHFADIDLGPDGALYVSDRTGNRVLRVTLSGTAEVLAEGAPLDGPHDLEFSPTGSLLIVNHAGHNVVERFADGSFVERVGGLAYPPLNVVSADNGDLYITTERMRGSEVAEERPGVYRVRADGTVERVFVYTYFLNGLRIVDGRVLVGAADPNFSSITELTQQPLTTGQLEEFRNEIPFIARFLLTYHQDSNAGNFDHAMRLIGLGEARSVVQDPGLQAEIDQAIDTLAAKLRANQRTDGGWNRVNDEQPSDPEVTAFSGLALDYTAPADDDPVVLAAIDFLLATQRPDHTWFGMSGRTATPFPPTGAVMAWLPAAIQKAGGLDTDVRIELPANIALSSPSLAPAAQTANAAGGTDYTWHLDRLSSAARSIEFDLMLAGMQLHEERPVASAAFLESENSFNGERLRVDLAIPTVSADDGVRLGLAADRASYGADQTVLLSAPVSNTGAGAASGVVGLRIVAVADNALVAEVPAQSFADLAAGAQQTLAFAWPTAHTRAGSYTARATLSLADGTFVDEAGAAFEIVAAEDGASVASLRTTTDRAAYHTSDRVQIGQLAQNLTSNYAIPGALLRVQVTSPSGTVVLAQDLPLGELPPQAIAERGLAQTLSAAAEGLYQVQGTLLDGAGAVLASASASYEVRDDRARSLAGTVTVAVRSLQQGDTQTCTDTVTNNGTLAASGVPIRQTLTRLDVDQTVSNAVATVDLAAGASSALTRSIATGPLTAGDYACALEAQVDGTWHGLGYAVFTVTPEPANLSATLGADQAGYDVTGALTLSATVHSQMQYRSVTGAAVRMEVASAAGAIVFGQDVPLPGTAPGASSNAQATFAFTDLAEGIYTASASVREAGAVVATAQVTIDVRKSLARAISASVSAALAEVPQGETQTCTDTLANSSIRVLAAVQVRQRLARTGVPQAVSSNVVTTDVPAQSSATLTRAFGTGELAEGTYACAVDALIGTDWQELGSAAFTVTPPPIRINASLTVGDKGRLLVLLDPPAANGDQTDPLGPTTGAPGLDAQRAYLEALLAKEGWSYTVVTDGLSFARELRSGAYSVYMAFSETVKLDQSLQQEIREAVFRGEGLVEAGSHDARNNTVDDALGLKFTGKHASADRVQFLPSPLSAGGSADYPVADKTLKPVLVDAVTEGYVTVAGTDHPAITRYAFGDGNSVYAAFDVMIHATLTGEPSLFSGLLRAAPEYVHPPLDVLKTGRVVPLTLTLANEGIATAGRTLVTLPAGSIIEDAGRAEITANDQLTWVYTLAEGGTQSLTVWIRLPAQEGAAPVHASVQVDRNGLFSEHTAVNLAAFVTRPAGLDEALAAVGTDLAFELVRQYLQDARQAIANGDYAGALAHLLRAADELHKSSDARAPGIRKMVGQAIFEVAQRL